MRQVNVGGETPLDTIPEASETDSTTPHLVIWGTNVSVAECKEKFKQFILRFIDINAEEDERTDDMNLNEPLYLQKLEEVSFLFKSNNFIAYKLGYNIMNSLNLNFKNQRRKVNCEVNWDVFL